MRQETVEEKITTTFYVAEDGTRFKDEESCKIYEEKQERQRLTDLVEKIEHIETEYAPFGYETDRNTFSYVWYRPKSAEDLRAIEKYYHLEFAISESKIGKLVGIEYETEYDGAWEMDLEKPFKPAVDFYTALGYDVTFTEMASNTEIISSRGQEFKFICDSIKSVNFEHLRALWTAYCIHWQIKPKYQLYEKRLVELWLKIAREAHAPWLALPQDEQFDRFFEFMSAILITSEEGEE